jgi:hypothetical protein
VAWLACHWLDAFRFITGEEIVRVQAELATLSDEPIDVEDTAALAFRTSSGAIGSQHAGYVLALGSPGYRAAGMRVLEILDAAYASAASGCAVAMERTILHS